MRINSNRSDSLIANTAAATSPAAKPSAAKNRDETSVLSAAKQGLQASPEIDMAKVQEIRAALLRGELNFDADKVAALMQRYHGGRA
ncbi:flagellar biosynthesis anti-sigma factor FlgM [Iodobacter sp. CM08]|uniref:flagellar biosynthesis anti-sigma factor FlgM n=1 Tax=Iodobacter sp. CM08 TaxID=3085902 RepID=UPI0029810CDB|nr:flagellar biosynthesis anti-sigma factor FlgM [Iodobacter sp. CM08]MDW5417377.1 flagellar biosynthesis anti-sigma factor FlgM [Iodobacter sp. CM08]